MSPTCRVRFSAQPKVQLVAEFVPSISSRMLVERWVLILDMRSLQIVMICEPESMTLAVITDSLTMTSISLRGREKSGSGHEVSLMRVRHSGMLATARAATSTQQEWRRSARSFHMGALAARI